MRLWRISDFADLSGEGGLLASARWHTRGRKIVYLSDHPASALLEVLVHLEVDADDMPSAFQLLAIEAPDDLAFKIVEEAALPVDWRRSTDVTQRRGDEWLKGMRTALLRVPSAIVPHGFNWLMNPAHPDSAQLRVVETATALFDPRLIR